MLKIATRQSHLALIQAEEVRQKWRALYPDEDVELLPLSTKGDQIQDRSLAELGGKGLFIKSLEAAMQDGRADLAVHSLKDVPPVLESGFVIAATLARLSPWDTLVSQKGGLNALPKAAVIGTSSVRRRAELLHYRPDLQVVMMRGNVETRLKKMEEGLCDALILAEAGLIRLGLTARITEVLPPDIFMPSVGQGVIAIEVLAERQDLLHKLAPLNDPATFACITAERAMNASLGASCTSPVGSFAEMCAGVLKLNGIVYNSGGKIKISTQQQGKLSEALSIAKRAADHLLEQGAQWILHDLGEE